MKRILLITLFSLFTFNGAFAQLNAVTVDSTVDTKITILDKKATFSTQTIGKYEKVKIWTKEQAEPVMGFATALNDSTLLVNDTEISINSIEKMRVTNPAGMTTGIILTTGGAALTAGGAFLVSDSFSGDGLGFDDIFRLIGGVVVSGTGVLTMATGTVLMAIFSKKVKMDRWEVNISDKPAG